MARTTQPLVSIILPTFNRATFLARSVVSVLQQDFDDFELLVIDDGSSDNTSEVLKKFSDSDSRLKTITLRRNQGAARARNVGLVNTAGLYIAFQDSDDEWLPRKLGSQVALISEEPNDVGIVYGDLIIVDGVANKRLKAPDFRPEDGIIYGKALEYGVWGLGIQTSVVRRECFSAVGGFDERLRRYIDLEFFIRLSEKYKFYRMDEALVRWHKDARGRISEDLEALLEAQKTIVSKYGKILSVYPKKLAIHYCALAKTLNFLNRRAEAREYVKKALRCDPLLGC
jgi:glycosyltransferase involved in cell wall biosynthesis